MAVPATNGTPSSTKHKLQCFVEIPPSPLHKTHRMTLSSQTPSSTNSSLKENTPFRPSRSNSDSTVMTSLTSLSSRSSKRKLPIDVDDSDRLSDPTQAESPLVKKPKLSAHSQSAASKGKVAQNKKPLDDDDIITLDEEFTHQDYPNGWFYCHQCAKKRDASFGIQCTMKVDHPRTGFGRCKTKYCTACLKNRYEEDMAELKSRDISTVPRKVRFRHFAGVAYCYECPKCRNECNCRNCRKAKGLEPTGNLKQLARKADVDSATALPKDTKAIHDAKKVSMPPKAAPPRPRMSKPVVLVPSRASTSKVTTARPAKFQSKPAPKPKPKAPPKPIPKPVWSRVYTPLSREHVEIRMNIREFVLRFSSVLQISNTNAEELEELSGVELGVPERWEDQEEGEELVGWVSENCTKAIVVGLLEILAGAANAQNAKHQVKRIREVLRTIKSGGPNLSRIWGGLSSLQDDMTTDEDSLPFHLSTPLPAPANTTVRTTRSVQFKGAESASPIIHSAQLVPIIADLIDIAITSGAPAIREAFEATQADEKESNRIAKEKITLENNKWKDADKDSKSKSKADLKDLKEKHKQTLQDVEFSHRVALHQYNNRFAPLGRDLDGRVYYAMGPGTLEREVAEQFIRGKKEPKLKYGKKKGVLTEDDRREMERWSWFVAIWGKKPVGAEVAKRKAGGSDGGDEDSDDEVDEDEEGWWGFWDVKQVKTLADWLAHRYQIEDEKEKGKDAASNPERSSSTPTLEDFWNRNLGVDKASKATHRVSQKLLDSRDMSPLSDISSDSDDKGEEMYTRVDSEGRPIPTRKDLQSLIRGLNDYADLLQWRVQKINRGVADDSVSQEKDKAEKRKPDAIPTKQFYS